MVNYEWEIMMPQDDKQNKSTEQKIYDYLSEHLPGYKTFEGFVNFLTNRSSDKEVKPEVKTKASNNTVVGDYDSHLPPSASKAKTSNEVTTPEKLLEIVGNSDAKILGRAFLEYSKNGLAKSGVDTIEKLDDVLKNADIVISSDNSTAVISQTDGKTFTLHAPKPSGQGR